MLSSIALKITTALKLEAKHGESKQAVGLILLLWLESSDLVRKQSCWGFNTAGHLLPAMMIYRDSFEKLECMRICLQLIIFFWEERKWRISVLTIPEDSFPTQHSVISHLRRHPICSVIYTGLKRALLLHNCPTSLGICKRLTDNLTISTDLSEKQSCGDGIPPQSTTTR